MDDSLPFPDRRKAGRRRADREPDSRPSEGDGSWFGGFGGGNAGPETGTGFDDPGPGAEGLPDSAPLAGDSRFLTREARRIVSEGTTAFGRMYATFVAARAAVGIALLLVQLVAHAFGVQPPAIVTLACAVYAAQAVATWLLPRWSARSARTAMTRMQRHHWLMTIGFDLLVFSALQLLAPGLGLNFVALLALPVLMAGVLTPRPQALATAAAVALVLLGSAWIAVQGGGEPTQLLGQAGLMGSGLFAISLLSGELAGRLAREETAARESLALARQQTQLNRLVIEEMQDGVLVVDRRGRVRAANPAARRLLAPSGVAAPAPFQLRGVEPWEPLVTAVEQAFAEAVWPDAGRDITLSFSPGLVRTLRTRVRFTRRRENPASEDFCVLFIDDLRAVQARTRQEKLAAMGRVSAGIAHEIRNPLAAIAQANALLAEDVTTDAQRRLTTMVSDNVQRLKRIVEDVMEVAPGAPPTVGAIALQPTVRAVCEEWSRTAGVVLGSGGALQLEMPETPIAVAFDVDHLRRVLVNLLENARRHGGEGPGAVLVRVASRDDRHAVLMVINGGTPIAPEVERFLFEPFFSTRSRGTGLGLYICRELCGRYGASIDYRQRPPSEALRNQFVVVMRREAWPDAIADDHRPSTSA